MSNAAQIAEIRREIQQILALLKEGTPRLERTTSNLQEQVRLLMISERLAKSVLGTANIPKGVASDLRKLEILVSELLYLRTVYLATMATLGPVGFALLTIGAIGGAISVSKSTRG